MIIIQFRQNLFHDGFTEKHCFGAHSELLAIVVYGSHFAVIQVYDLPMTTHKGFLLLLQVFGIYS